MLHRSEQVTPNLNKSQTENHKLQAELYTTTTDCPVKCKVPELFPYRKVRTVRTEQLWNELK